MTSLWSLKRRRRYSHLIGAIDFTATWKTRRKLSIPKGRTKLLNKWALLWERGRDPVRNVKEALLVWSKLNFRAVCTEECDVQLPDIKAMAAAPTGNPPKTSRGWLFRPLKRQERLNLSLRPRRYAGVAAGFGAESSDLQAKDEYVLCSSDNLLEGWRFGIATREGFR